MQSGVKTLSAGGGASLCCLLLLWLIYSHLLREGKSRVSYYCIGLPMVSQGFSGTMGGPTLLEKAHKTGYRDLAGTYIPSEILHLYKILL